VLKRGLVAVAAAALLAGCGAPPVSETTPFVAAEHERCAGNGHGRVVGRATVRAGDGQDRPAAWDEVVLWPSSPYSRTLATELAAGDRPAPEARLAPYARIVRADSAGRFTFEDLPPCRYVALLAVPGSLAGLRAGTGYAAAEAEVAEGRTVTLALAWPPTEPFRAAPATAPVVAERPKSAPAKAPVAAEPPRSAPATAPAAVAGPPPPRPEPKPPVPVADGAADPCAPYARDPVLRLRCEWVTGPERDRFVLPPGREASLRARMDCIPDRDDPARYAACIASRS